MKINLRRKDYKPHCRCYILAIVQSPASHDAYILSPVELILPFDVIPISCRAHFPLGHDIR